MSNAWVRLYAIYERMPGVLRAPFRPFVSSPVTLRWLVWYVFIGLCGIALYLALLECLLLIGVSPLVATAIACVVSASLQFMVNRNRNFRAFNRPILQQAMNYVLIGLCVLALTMVLVFAGIHVLRLPPFTANALTLLVTTPLAYLANRHLTFGPGIR